MIEGEKLAALLKHGAAIHIIEPDAEIDYYGALELLHILLHSNIEFFSVCSEFFLYRFHS